MKNTKILDCIKTSFELKSQGFYKPAIEMLYKALTIEPENLEILAQLAHLYKLLNNNERAIYYVEKVLELNSSHLGCLSLQKDIYIDQGDLKHAQKIVDKMCELQPTAENIAEKLQILNKLDDFESIQKIQKTQKETSDDIIYEYAFAYYNHGDSKTATELLELAYSKNNKNEKILALLAKIYYENNKFIEAKKLLLKLEEIAPNSQTLDYLGLLELQDLNFNNAIEYFAKAKKLDGTKSEFCYNLATAYFLAARFDEAMKEFNLAICMEPKNVDYHYSLAYLYYQKKEYDKALKELRFINGLNPDHHNSKVLNAMITAQQGDLLIAKNLLETILKDNKSDDFAFYALSFVQSELNNFDAAKKSIKQAIALNPQSLNYLSELVSLEVEQKNYKEALDLVEKIISINPKYILAYIFLAKIKMAQAEYEEVFDAAQDIIKLDSNTPEGYYYNAIALFEQGDINFAIESLKKSISIDLSNATLYAKMSEFYQQLSDFKMAYEWAKEASDIDERNYKYKWLCAKLAVKLHNEDDALKNYSQSYRLGAFDNDLKTEYVNYLKSIGKHKQAEKLLK